MTSDGRILQEDHGRVRRLTLSRPDKLNALAGDMREQLTSAVADAARAEGVDALVLTGAGRGFCAGGDVSVMADLHARRDHDGFRRILHAGAECVLALQAFPGLTVAALNGVAAGAGLGLALACDLRVAAPGVKLAASWGGIGLAPDWGATYWLPRLLGRSRATAMVLGVEATNADRALTLGLINEIVDADDLLARAHEIAGHRGAPRAMVRSVKSLLGRGEVGTLEQALAAETEAQEALFAGDDVGEGIAAVRERRAPRFGRDR